MLEDDEKRREVKVPSEIIKNNTALSWKSTEVMSNLRLCVINRYLVNRRLEDLAHLNFTV